MPITNNFKDILDVAQSISATLHASVSVYPHVNIKNGKVDIRKCHICVLPEVPSPELECNLLKGGFQNISSREDEGGVIWESWNRDVVCISIGKKI